MLNLRSSLEYIDFSFVDCSKVHISKCLQQIKKVNILDGSEGSANNIESEFVSIYEPRLKKICGLGRFNLDYEDLLGIFWDD